MELREIRDLDVLIEPSRLYESKLIAALQTLGLEIPDIKPHEFEENVVLSFGFEPEAIDILSQTPGLEFDAVYNNSHLVSFSGIKIRMIDIRDLIKNKKNIRRKGDKSLLDRYDIEILKKIIRKKH